MTTSRSPLRVLRAHADRIARTMKEIERGGGPPVFDPEGKIAASRVSGFATVGVVMDDKTIQLRVEWSTVRSTSETALSAYLLRQMRGARETEH